MRQNKIAKVLYIPIKNNKYLIDKHYRVKVYKSLENLKKYNKEDSYDNILTYGLMT